MRHAAWLVLSLATALFGACGDDDSGDPGPPAGSGGDGGTGDSAGAGGSSAEPGAGGTSENGGAGTTLAGQGGFVVGGAGGAPVQLGEVVIAEGQEAPTGIALDADNVYWANQGSGTIVRCPLSGCGDNEPTTLVTGIGRVRGITVDSESVYWVDSPETETNEYVYRCPLAGCDGPPDELVVLDPNVANDVHVVGDTLYYAAWPFLGTCPTDGCEGAPVDLALGPIVSVDSDADYFYTARHGWQQIFRCTFPDCTDDALLLDNVFPISVAVDETTLYFAEYNGLGFYAGNDVARISRCPLATCGEDPPELVKDGDISPYAIALNGSRLFFTNFEHGTVVSLPK